MVLRPPVPGPQVQPEHLEARQLREDVEQREAPVARHDVRPAQARLLGEDEVRDERAVDVHASADAERVEERECGRVRGERGEVVRFGGDEDERAEVGEVGYEEARVDGPLVQVGELELGECVEGRRGWGKPGQVGDAYAVEGVGVGGYEGADRSRGLSEVGVGGRGKWL